MNEVLHADIIEYFCRFLSFKQRFVICEVSKYWKTSLERNPNFWKTCCKSIVKDHHDFEITELQDGIERDFRFWKSKAKYLLTLFHFVALSSRVSISSRDKRRISYVNPKDKIYSSNQPPVVAFVNGIGARFEVSENCLWLFRILNIEDSYKSYGQYLIFGLIRLVNIKDIKIIQSRFKSDSIYYHGYVVDAACSRPRKEDPYSIKTKYHTSVIHRRNECENPHTEFETGNIIAMMYNGSKSDVDGDEYDAFSIFKDESKIYGDKREECKNVQKRMKDSRCMEENEKGNWNVATIGFFRNYKLRIEFLKVTKSNRVFKDSDVRNERSKKPKKDSILKSFIPKFLK